MRKLFLNSFVFSIALRRPATILLVTKEITCFKKKYKNIFLEACHECAKGLLSMQKSVI
jgi:hypothetical protein